MKLKVHIDSKGYKQKPNGKEVGGIKTRLQKDTSPSFVTVEELALKIRTGHSISPGIMEGMSAKDWKEQQLFLVDIDNEEDEPIFHPKDAKRICHEYGLSPAFYYQTFSHCKEKPKFRIAFIMDSPVIEEARRKRIIETLVDIFPQSDKSCVNADRIFHGTNKRVTLLSESARISWETIRSITLPTRNKKQLLDPPSHPSGRSDPELEKAIRHFDLFEYLKERNGNFRRNNNSIVFNNCEICGHHDNLMYVPDTRNGKISCPLLLVSILLQIPKQASIMSAPPAEWMVAFGADGASMPAQNTVEISVLSSLSPPILIIAIISNIQFLKSSPLRETNMRYWPTSSYIKRSFNLFSSD